MGQLVLAAAGAAVGSTFGPMGAQVGWAIGGYIGGMIFKEDQPRPSIMDLRVAGTEYGQCIPYIVAGEALVAPQIWWNSERIVTIVEGESAKGGGPQGPSTATYKIHLLCGLCNNEIYGIKKIFNNGKLIWTNADDATPESVAASEETLTWERMTVYTGAADQMPDPVYEAAVGTANAVAYRGRGSVFLEGVDLGTSGALPNFTFLVVRDGELAGTAGAVSYDDTATADPLIFQDEVTGYIWRCTNVSTVPTDFNLTVTDEEGQTQFVSMTLSHPGGALDPGFCRVDHLNEIWLGGWVWLANDYVWIFDATSGVYKGAFDLGYRGTGRMNGITYNSFDQKAITTGFGGAARAIDCLNRVVDSIAFGMPLPGVHFIWDVFETNDHIAVAGHSGAGNFICFFNRSDYSLHGTATGFGGLPYYGYAYDPTRDVVIHTHTAGGLGYDIIDVATLAVTIGTLNVPDGADTEANLTITANMRNVAYSPFNDRYIFGMAAESASSKSALWLLNPDTLLCENVYAYETFEEGTPVDSNKMTVQSYAPLNGEPYVIICDITTVKRYYLPYGTATVCQTVQETVRRVCNIAKLEETEHYIVTALSSITREVCSFVISQVIGMRQPLEQLMTGYFFDAATSDKIHFIPRGGTEVATIPYEALGATLEGNTENPEPFVLKMISDLEVPAFKELKFLNISNDFQPGIEISDRLITSTTNTVEQLELAGLSLTPTEAKKIVDTIALDQAASLATANVSVLGDYPELEPTDPIIVVDREGSEFRMRIIKRMDSYPLMQFDLVMDDTSVLESQGITSVDYESSTEVEAPADTIYELLDVPIGRDVDDDSGFYVVAKGDTDLYYGSGIYSSPDNVTYSLKVKILESGIFGDTTTALGDWTGYRVIDEINSVTVDVGDDSELSSSTRSAVLNSQSVNAWIIGNEGIQAIVQEYISPGVYRLSRLLRGSRGTEWAMTGHVAGERAIFIREAGMRRIAMDNSDLGLSRYYKGVMLGRPLSSDYDPQSFTNMAIGLKPFSPVNLRAERDASNNITFTIQPRTRLSVRMIGALGISVPFGYGEDTENYSIDIYADGTYATVINTLTALTYSAAQQTTDGLTPGDPVYVRAYKISSVVGRGYALEGAV